MVKARNRREAVKLLAAAGASAAAAPWLSGCVDRRRTPTPPRLVLLYATCSVNASYLSPYGGDPSLTPFLTRFAQESAVLTRHQTEAGQSGIAFASIFSGTQADRHGVYDHPRVLRPEAELITEAFAAAGYEVFFWGAHGMASYRLGYGQGVPEGNHRMAVLEAGDPLFETILGRLAADPTYRAFILTNFTVTHMKYTANENFFDDDLRGPEALPEHFASLGLAPEELIRYRELLFDGASTFSLSGRYRQTIQRWGLSEEEEKAFQASMDYLYRCAIHRLDGLFGGVLRRIEESGVSGHSLVAFTADHGETLYRDETLFKYAHGFQLAPEVLRVPLMIRAPSAGVGAGRLGLVSRSIDVFPTLAGLSGVGLSVDRPPQGVDLSACLTGRAPPPELTAFSHTSLVHEAIVANPEYRDSLLHQLFPARDPELMWVSARHGDTVVKWGRSASSGEDFRATAFDLDADPWERRDLHDPDYPLHRRLLTELMSYKARLVAAYAQRPPDSLDEAERVKELKALGYLE